MSIRSKADAVTALAQLTLSRPVTVNDTVGILGQPVRSFSFANPDGSSSVVNLALDPDDAEIDTLARNLPVPPEKRQETVDKLRQSARAAAEALGR
jgi:hypothetical protein